MISACDGHISYSLLDRCGTNWKTGKGGCGLLIQSEVSNTLATMFHPFIFRRGAPLLAGRQRIDYVPHKGKTP